jgi:hypothetical protein
MCNFTATNTGRCLENATVYNSRSLFLLVARARSLSLSLSLSVPRANTGNLSFMHLTIIGGWTPWGGDQ